MMISLIIGIVLGLWFKVFVLVPAIGLALATAAVHGVVVEEGIWWLVGTMVEVATFIQLGYLGGSILRSVTDGTRAAEKGKASMPASNELASQ